MTEHDLGDLLKDAVSEIEPRRGLDEIQARTSRSHRRTWVWGAVAAVAATAATVAGVTVLTDEAPRQVGGTPAASTSADPTPTQAVPSSTPSDSPTGAVAAGGALPVYYVGETPSGPRLFREFAPRRRRGGQREVARSSRAGHARRGAGPRLRQRVARRRQPGRLQRRWAPASAAPGTSSTRSGSRSTARPTSRRDPPACRKAEPDSRCSSSSTPPRP